MIGSMPSAICGIVGRRPLQYPEVSNTSVWSGEPPTTSELWLPSKPVEDCDRAWLAKSGRHFLLWTWQNVVACARVVKEEPYFSNRGTHRQSRKPKVQMPSAPINGNRTSAKHTGSTAMRGATLFL